MSFKLLISDVKFDQDADGGQKGTAAFINDSTGAYASLPIIGAGFAFLGTTAATCQLRHIHMEYFERDETRIKYMLEYSTPDKNKDPKGNSTDAEDRKWSFGGDMVNLTKTTGWSWSVGGTNVPIGNVGIARRVITINYTRPTALLSSDTAFKAAIIACSGKVNSDNFEGWGVGNVLCQGATGGVVRNQAGDIRYRYEVGFSVRGLPGIGGGTNGWQYVMREDGTWDRPIDGSGNFLYGSASFGGLF